MLNGLLKTRLQQYYIGTYKLHSYQTCLTSQSGWSAKHVHRGCALGSLYLEIPPAGQGTTPFSRSEIDDYCHH